MGRRPERVRLALIPVVEEAPSDATAARPTPNATEPPRESFEGLLVARRPEAYVLELPGGRVVLVPRSDVAFLELLA